MGTLILFELKKIVGNRAGMVACALAFVLVAGLAVLNYATATTSDCHTGERIEGFAAQQAYRDWKNLHAGVLDDERVAQDMAAFVRAQDMMRENDDLGYMTAREVIDSYGQELYQEVYAVICDGYYDQLSNALEAATPQATSLEEGARERIKVDLGAGFMGVYPYTQAEQDFWLAKAAQVEWPIEYGAAIAWENSLDYLSYLGLAIAALCIALSGTFAGEYQARTAAVALPTRRGKRVLPAAKIIAALTFATAYWWVCGLVVLGINGLACGFDGRDLPLQVTGFANPYALTMGEATALRLVLGWLIALGMAAFTLLLSAKMRSTMPVAIVPMAVVLLGLVGLFFAPVAKLAALTPMSGLDWSFVHLVSYAAGSVVLDLPTMLALVYGVMLVALTPFAMRSFKRHQVA